MEPFTYADYFIAKGRSLDIISQCQVIETFQWLREAPKYLYAGLYMLKLVNSGTVEGQQHPELFDLLLVSLLKLREQLNPKKIAKEFEKEYVMLEGIYREGIDPQYILSEHFGKDLRSW